MVVEGDTRGYNKNLGGEGDPAHSTPAHPSLPNVAFFTFQDSVEIDQSGVVCMDYFFRFP